ncbi:hypothetical protein IGB42_01211 [Andreprevotia sp. IGB-42]|uniref:VIT1/CCC1 transporter family protein n=1 Tax=Andreprevotia sp. IGB-42 TaxID=2497473 RepID=UPI00135681C0|nr:VIT1/CCC1 transporter family protein [Andreprevotia sp. IGB-42]KAF0814310.1 hypothetical protein IGB42_01211 [Andreprevotia sp. IGB-42]
MQADELSPESPARVLDPVDRATEVIFGLLMAMTFIGSLSVATAGQEAVHTMQLAALGCNLAWGLADAVMYLIRAVVERTRSQTLLARLGKTDAKTGQALIAEALPARLSVAANAEILGMLRLSLLSRSAQVEQRRLSWNDLKGASGVFLLVVLATFPVVIPFMLLDQVAIALRVSNLVALGILFIAGWVLARYSGGRPLLWGVAMAVIGTLLMTAIMALGG